MDIHTETVEITIDCLSAMAIIANIQLATRHPSNVGPSRQISEDFARKLQGKISEKFPEMAAMMDMGWNPKFDC